MTPWYRGNYNPIIAHIADPPRRNTAEGGVQHPHKEPQQRQWQQRQSLWHARSLHDFHHPSKDARIYRLILYLVLMKQRADAAQRAPLSLSLFGSSSLLCRAVQSDAAVLVLLGVLLWTAHHAVTSCYSSLTSNAQGWCFPRKKTYITHFLSCTRLANLNILLFLGYVRFREAL